MDGPICPSCGGENYDIHGSARESENEIYECVGCYTTFQVNEVGQVETVE